MKVHFVKSARKAIGEQVQVGESYYWWKFRHGGKCISKTYPKRSQLTRSEYYQQLYDIEDELSNLYADDTLPGNVEDIASRLRDIASECENRRDNMPEQLQDSASGDLLQQRADGCNSAADELESIDFDVPELEEDEEGNDNQEEIDDFWNEKLEEVQNITIEIN